MKGHIGQGRRAGLGVAVGEDMAVLRGRDIELHPPVCRRRGRLKVDLSSLASSIFNRLVAEGSNNEVGEIERFSSDLLGEVLYSFSTAETTVVSSSVSDSSSVSVNGLPVFPGVPGVQPKPSNNPSHLEPEDNVKL